MKKIRAAMLGVGLYVGMTTAVYAAHVSVSTPAAEGESSYMLGGDIEQVFENVTSGLGIVDPTSNLNNEELIFLGAHETIDYDRTDEGGTRVGDNQVAVNVNKAGESGVQSGPVSLILSAAESLKWNIEIDETIQISNIYIFSIKQQELTINGSNIAFGTNPIAFDGINIVESDWMECGYTLPADDQGCNTDMILGINFGEDSNPVDDDFLNELTDSDVTNFNGSYLVDGFNIDVDTVVVPLPGSQILFGLAIGLLFSRKLFAKS